MKLICNAILAAKRGAALTAALLLMLGWGVQESNGQFIGRWLSIGELHEEYSESGGEATNAFSHQDFAYPGIHHGESLAAGQANWLSVVDWTDENGKTWPVKTLHNGIDAPGAEENFPVKHELISRFEPTEVYVDGFETFGRYVPEHTVDPSIPADRMIHNVVNTYIGLTMERKIYAFSNEHHDNYHIIEHTFTNTGNVDGDEEIELPEQTLKDAYYFPIQNYSDMEGAKMVDWGSVWGRSIMNDMVGDGQENYETDLRATYAWHGYSPRYTKFNSLGVPAIDGSEGFWDSDTTGRLASAWFVGQATLHADKSVQDNSNDPKQPATSIFFDYDRTEVRSPKPFDAQQMQDIRKEWITAGHMYPHHADLVTGEEAPWDRDRFARQNQDPGVGLTGGYSTAQGYGPYTLAPEESFTVVTVKGADGLAKKASYEIGNAFKKAWQEGDEWKEIGFDANGDGTITADETMSKQHWVMTARDSLFQTFERATANYESGYDIPKPPMPPKEFRVTSGVDKIDLSWELQDGANPEGFEIYRGRISPRGAPETGFQYKKVTTLGAGASSYEDREVSRGINYYYYIQAVGKANTDSTGHTPVGVALKSNRYYTQTHDPAILKRPPGSGMANARVVPNPLYLGNEETLRWPERDYRVAFLDIPGNCTIKIFTEMGEQIRTLEHTDGSGDEYWNLTTSSNQIVVSGIYLAVITNNETGEQITRKIIVVR